MPIVPTLKIPTGSVEPRFKILEYGLYRTNPTIGDYSQDNKNVYCTLSFSFPVFISDRELFGNFTSGLTGYGPKEPEFNSRGSLCRGLYGGTSAISLHLANRLMFL